jgi:hypothetical protein
VILFRCFAWDREVGAEARGGALWFPRMLQGDGRHDRPDRYGCLYASESRVSAVVEQLGRFRGQTLAGDRLLRFRLPLALAELHLDDGAEVLDLDDPAVLQAERLRPSLVATHERARTQADAAALFERRPSAQAIRWWSTFESQWANVTLFDRAAGSLAVRATRPLSLEDVAVTEAAAFLGLRVTR